MTQGSRTQFTSQQFNRSTLSDNIWVSQAPSKGNSKRVTHLSNTGRIISTHWKMKFLMTSKIVCISY